MVDRLRVLLDRPLDPSAARAILVFASAIFIGFAALFALAAGQPDRPSPRPARPASTSSFASPYPREDVDVKESKLRPAVHRQDPQDREGTTAARRAGRSLRSHRALQHVPYRDGEVTIVLAGAQDSRALLRVTASTLPGARQGWHRFLARFRDTGRAYIPIFRQARETRWLSGGRTTAPVAGPASAGAGPDGIHLGALGRGLDDAVAELPRGGIVVRRAFAPLFGRLFACRIDCLFGINAPGIRLIRHGFSDSGGSALPTSQYPSEGCP